MTQLLCFLSHSTHSQSRHFHSSSMSLQHIVSYLPFLPSFWHLWNIKNNLLFKMKHLSEQGNIYIELSKRGIYTPKREHLKWSEAKLRISLSRNSDHNDVTTVGLKLSTRNSPENDSFYDHISKKPENSPLYCVSWPKKKCNLRRAELPHCTSTVANSSCLLFCQRSGLIKYS